MILNTALPERVTDDDGVAARWLARWSLVLASGIVAVGLIIRLAAIDDTYLHFDEVMHFETGQGATLAETYSQAQRFAHPPLVFLVYHVWQWFGESATWLRLLSVSIGVAALTIWYFWMRRALGAAPALVGLTLLTFAAPMVQLSVEARGYMLLLLAVGSSVYCQERAFSSNSIGWMLGLGVCELIAVLTHFAAVWCVAALGISVLVRFLLREGSWRLAAAWVSTQLATAATLGWLYVTRIRELRGSNLEQEAIDSWLEQWYFQPAKESMAAFAWRTTSLWFQHASAYLPHAGTAGLALWLGGITYLAFHSGFKSTRSRRLGLVLLLIAPFVCGLTAGLLGLYPFGASRHSAYLLPFAAAAVAAPAAVVIRGRWAVAGAVVVAAALAAWSTFNARWGAGPRTLHAHRAVVRIALAELARRNIDQRPVLVDGMTRYTFRYYVDPNSPLEAVAHHGGVNEYRIGPHPTFVLPAFDALEGFEEQFRLAERELGPRLDGGFFFISIGSGEAYRPGPPPMNGRAIVYRERFPDDIFLIEIAASGEESKHQQP